MGRSSKTQLQVGEHLKKITEWYMNALVYMIIIIDM